MTFDELTGWASILLAFAVLILAATPIEGTKKAPDPEGPGVISTIHAGCGRIVGPSSSCD